jgi:signal transduction histidine kinase
VLYLDHRTEAGLFDEERQSFLEILVAQVALAIENARLSETLQQVHQTKSKFVSVVTHELRIPMTSIKGYTDLLRQGAVGPVNDMQLNFLNVIRSNVERMSSLVSDLADLSRMESGRLKLECEHVSVMDSLGEALNGVRPALQGKNLQLTVEAGPDLPKAFTDPNRLVQILNILLSNAWKYTPEEGKIQISVRRQASTLFFEVRDTGIGISRQDQEKLFTQFFRSDDSVVREQQGWGLGLAVARGLVQLSGGAMGFESQPGQGSAFWFTLPLDAISVKDPRPLGKDEKTKTG